MFNPKESKLMGGIIFWGIIRVAVLIPALWILKGMVEYKYWWWLGILSVYGVIIHPAMIQFRLFMEENKDIIDNTLCSSCKHFDKTAVLCTKFDKHPTLRNLPCEGLDWEMKDSNYEAEEIHP